MPRTYTEVAEIVDSLDREFQTLRDDARRRHDLYALRKEPIVPDEIAREGKVRIVSPLLMHSAQTIRADLMMNPTEFMVIPLARERDGAISSPMERRAENLERSLAVIWGRLNEGRRIDRDVIWHQLVSPFGVIILQFKEYEPPDQPDWMSDEAYVDLVDSYEREWMPWDVYMPDPLTCSFLERDGEPVLFARRYKMLVHDIEYLYSKRAGSREPDKNLRYLDGNWRWVSDDYDTSESRTRAGLKEVDVRWLDDGNTIYHIADHPDHPGIGGEVVWEAPNPTGRVTAYIVPGNQTPSRKPEDRYEPFLLPLMQALSDINNLRSMRATAARNLAGPHMYVPVDPEIQKQYIARGERLPLAHRWRKNEIAYLLGKVESLPSELSPDWDRVEQAVNDDMQRLLPSPFVHIVDPAVLKSATATSILHAAETGLRMYGPLMSAYDATIRDIMEFGIVGSLRRHYDDLEINAFATGDEMASGRNLARGSLYKLNYDAVNFPHKILVKTRGMSQAQASAQYELAVSQWILPDGAKGPATLDDLIDAANYTDRTAQKMKLAKESILNEVDPWLRAQAIQLTRRKVLLDSGIDVPIGPQDDMLALGGGGDERTPSRLPNRAQTMASPQIIGPEGGTTPLIEGA